MVSVIVSQFGHNPVIFNENYVLYEQHKHQNSAPLILSRSQYLLVNAPYRLVFRPMVIFLFVHPKLYTLYTIASNPRFKNQSMLFDKIPAKVKTRSIKESHTKESFKNIYPYFGWLVCRTHYKIIIWKAQGVPQ